MVLRHHSRSLTVCQELPQVNWIKAHRDEGGTFPAAFCGLAVYEVCPYPMYGRGSCNFAAGSVLYEWVTLLDIQLISVAIYDA